MKKILFVTLLSIWPLLGQNTLTLTTTAPQCSASSAFCVKSGTLVTLDLAYAGASVDGLQWTTPLPSGVSTTAVAGSAATSSSAQKTLYCNPAFSSCLLAGLNTNPLAAGQMAVYTATLPTAAGSYTFSVTGTLGASATGTAVTVGAGSSIVIQVLSRYDLNGDGVVNIQDVQLAAAQADGSSSCTTANFLNDGCTVDDVVLVTLASLGVIPQ